MKMPLYALFLQVLFVSFVFIGRITNGAEPETIVLGHVSAEGVSYEIFTDIETLKRQPIFDPETSSNNLLSSMQLVKSAREICRQWHKDDSVSLAVISIALVKASHLEIDVWHYEVSLVPQIFKNGGRPIYTIPIFLNGDRPSVRQRQVVR